MRPNNPRLAIGRGSFTVPPPRRSARCAKSSAANGLRQKNCDDARYGVGKSTFPGLLRSKVRMPESDRTVLRLPRFVEKCDSMFMLTPERRTEEI